MHAQSLSRVRLFTTPWAVAHQAPLYLEFSSQEYWNGLPFPPPGNLADPGIEPRSPALLADSLPAEPPGKFYLVSVCLPFTVSHWPKQLKIRKVMAPKDFYILIPKTCESVTFHGRRDFIFKFFYFFVSIYKYFEILMVPDLQLVGCKPHQG